MDVLDGWEVGFVESWMIMCKDIMNILQSAKEIWRCEQVQKNLPIGKFILYPGV